jgi:bacterial/archaeal transporter family protein
MIYMWAIFAFGSAFFAGVTAILAKVGIKNVNSNVATAIRTVVILAFSWLMVFITGSQSTLGDISAHTLLFLALSGIATGASWLCYFRALQLGDVNKVAPIDKSSTVLTMLLAFIFLGEGFTATKLAGMLGIAVGTYMMITKKHSQKSTENGCSWLVYAVLSAVFASLTAILGKVGIAGVDSNLGTALRTCVVLLMAWAMVFITRKQGEIKCIDKRSMAFICLSGITTGLSWLCYYRALQIGEAGIVVPIDKLSILVTVAFSYIILHEKLSKKAAWGLCLLTLGTLALLF